MTVPFTTQSLQDALTAKLALNFGTEPGEATDQEMLKACALVLRDVMALRGVQTAKETKIEKKKQVHYLSLEFLMGRSLMKNAYNLGILPQLTQAVEERGSLRETSIATKKCFARAFEQDMSAVMVFSIFMAIAIFMVLPLLIAGIFRKFIHSETVMAILEGCIRIAIFITYIKVISRMDDIKRTFMYHGSEHKCINCLEHGLVLNVENVRKSSKEHKRCGTSFLLIVMVISILFFMVVRVDTIWLRIVSRIVLIPVIAGVSYEVLRLAGTSNSKIMDIVSRPGMWMQGLTTKEPDDSMIEVAIVAVEAVFDWKKYLEENFPEQYPAGYFEREDQTGKNAQEITA